MYIGDFADGYSYGGTAAPAKVQLMRNDVTQLDNAVADSIYAGGLLDLSSLSGQTVTLKQLTLYNALGAAADINLGTSNTLALTTNGEIAVNPVGTGTTGYSANDATSPAVTIRGGSSSSLTLGTSGQGVGITVNSTFFVPPVPSLANPDLVISAPIARAAAATPGFTFNSSAYPVYDANGNVTAGSNGYGLLDGDSIPYEAGPGTIVLTGASTYTDATTITGANLIIRGGSVAASGFTVQYGGSLTIDESTSSPTVAPFTGTAAPTLTFNGDGNWTDTYPNILSVIGNSTAATSVTLGNVTLNQAGGVGLAAINATYSGQPVTLNLGTITRSSGATLQIKPIGADLGSGITINAAGVATATDISQSGTAPLAAGTDGISFSSAPTPAGPSTTAAKPPIPWPRTSPPRPSKPLPSPAPPAAPGTSRSTALPPPRPWPPPLRRPRCRPLWTT